MFNDEQYDEQYKISCDCIKNIKLMLEEYTFRKIDVVVCVFDKHGISTSSIDRNVEEYHNAVEEIVPKHIMSLVSIPVWPVTPGVNDDTLLKLSSKLFNIYK